MITKSTCCQGRDSSSEIHPPLCVVLCVFFSWNALFSFYFACFDLPVSFHFNVPFKSYKAGNSSGQQGKGADEQSSSFLVSLKCVLKVICPHEYPSDPFFGFLSCRIVFWNSFRHTSVQIIALFLFLFTPREEFSTFLLRYPMKFAQELEAEFLVCKKTPKTSSFS